MFPAPATTDTLSFFWHQGAYHARAPVKNQFFYCNEKHQDSFDSMKQELADATALAAPNEEGHFVLLINASAVAEAGNFH